MSILESRNESRESWVLIIPLSDLHSDCKGVKASLLMEHRSQTLLKNAFILYISGDGI